MLSTQWTVSFSGPAGLHYPTVFQLLDRKGYANEEWWHMFEDLRLMERSALEAMRDD